MSSADIQALLPLILLSASAVVAMLAIAVRRNHALIAGLTVAGLVLSLASLGVSGTREVAGLLGMGPMVRFFIGLIVAATIAVAVLSYGYFSRQQVAREELYVLLLLAVTGSSVMIAARHFVSFFLGLEILSVSLYALIGYRQKQRQSLEAAIKYLVLAAASAAFLLFGMALVYADSGTLEFARMYAAAAAGNFRGPLLLPGFALVVTGVGFKLAVVPFHLWTPDVYQGAPAPVTAFVATVSKGAVLAFLLQLAPPPDMSYGAISVVIAIIAIASMIAGNLLALLQTSVKRILAYSSIAHLGYLLVAYQAGGAAGTEAAAFYLVAYFITTLGAFGIVAVLSTGDREADAIADYRGLFWRRPVLAAVFTAMLLSLAGIPLTAGFIGKFFIVAAGASAGAWALIVILVVTSAIGLYYYLRIIVALYSAPPEVAPSVPLAPASAAVLAVLTTLLFALGVYPAPLVDLISK